MSGINFEVVSGSNIKMTVYKNETDKIVVDMNLPYARSIAFMIESCIDNAENFGKDINLLQNEKLDV